MFEREIGQSRAAIWHHRLDEGEDCAVVSSEAGEADVSAMPIRRQMEPQWRLVTAGIEQVESQIRC